MLNYGSPRPCGTEAGALTAPSPLLCRAQMKLLNQHWALQAAAPLSGAGARREPIIWVGDKAGGEEWLTVGREP